MRRFAGWAIVVALAGGVTDARGQDYTPPRQMGLEGAPFGLRDTTQFRFELSNEVSGFIVPDLHVPLVELVAYIRMGWGDDRRQGAAEFLETAFRRGPCWMGPTRFNTALAEMAADFDVEMGPELTTISLNVPAEDVVEGVRLFSGVVREPCIDQDALEAFQTSGARAFLATTVDSTPSGGPAVSDGSMDTAVRLFDEWLYDNHRYTHVLTPGDVAELQVDHVEDFFREFVHPRNMVLAVAGLFRVEEMIRLVDQRFADWELRLPPRFREAPRLRTADRATHRFQADKLQNWVVMGHRLPLVDPRDIPALHVMNYILGGGHFDTRLFRETRDKRGLTNDASGFLTLNARGPGSYVFRTSSRPRVVDELIQVVFEEIGRIRTELVSEEELFVAKGALVDGHYAIRFENGYAVAKTFAREYAVYGTFEPLLRYPDRIAEVTAEDVRRAAERYLQPDQMQVIIVGPTP